MSIRDKILRMLSRGAPTDDPSEFIEISRLPIAQGPMTVDRLRDEGFHPRGAEAFSVLTKSLTDYSISVARHEAQAASMAIDRWPQIDSQKQ